MGVYVGSHIQYMYTVHGEAIVYGCVCRSHRPALRGGSSPLTVFPL